MEKKLNIFAAIVILLALLFVLTDYGFYKKSMEGPQTQKEIREAVAERESLIVQYKQEKIDLKLEIERVEDKMEALRAEISDAKDREVETELLDSKLVKLKNLKEDLEEQVKRLKSITVSVEGELEPLLLKYSD